jgi:predicted RecA/RadA family phage recombinase
MATTPQANFVRSALTERTLLVDPAVAGGVINSGDMVYSTGSGVASLSTPGASNANAANFIGVCRDTNPIPVAAGITETPATPIACTLTVEGVFGLKATNGQTFAPDAAVYLGADGQTVSTTATGTQIGTVDWDQAAAGGIIGGSIVGTGTNLVLIRIKPAIV